MSTNHFSGGSLLKFMAMSVAFKACWLANALQMREYGAKS